MKRLGRFRVWRTVGIWYVLAEDIHAGVAEVARYEDEAQARQFAAVLNAWLDVAEAVHGKD